MSIRILARYLKEDRWGDVPDVEGGDDGVTVVTSCLPTFAYVKLFCGFCKVQSGII